MKKIKIYFKNTTFLQFVLFVNIDEYLIRFITL